jgi:DNA-binding SARP family transcriptional activator
MSPVEVAQEPRYRVRMLGCFEVSDAAVRQLPAAAQRLVALLCLEGTRSRRQIAGLLWPEAPDGAALANLRTTLWRLGRAAPGLVQAGVSNLQMALVSSDVAALDAALDRADGEGEPQAAETAKTARTLLSCSSTEILPTWPDEWVQIHRERIQMLWLELADLTVDRLLTTGQTLLALRLANLAASIDPLRESTQARMIRAHLASGNRAAAQHAFDRLRERLVLELGVSPDPSLTVLLERGVHAPAPLA